MDKLNKKDYQNLLRCASTTTYKKANKSIETKINKEGINFAKQANILDKIDINTTGNSFITLKDHKKNFIGHPTTRLTNSPKNKIEKKSKYILVQINAELVTKLSVNEWKKMISVIKWFKKLITRDCTNFRSLI